MDRAAAEALRIRGYPFYPQVPNGTCIGNLGPGGYGVVLLYGPHRKELSGGFRHTTNNRMEIAIASLQTLKEPCIVTLYSDSQYLVDAVMKGWAKRWRANNWKRNKKEKAIGPGLWQQVLALCDRHEVTFVWVRGHAGNVKNERCDRSAVQVAKQKNLPPRRRIRTRT